MSQFIQDTSYLGALTGISTGPRGRFARCLAMVHSAVPCKEELVGTKSTAVVVTILRVLSDGFSSAPYQMAKKGGGAAQPLSEKAEPLFRMDNSKQPPELETWSYVSKGMNRGPRVGGVVVKTEDNVAASTGASPPMYVIGSGTSFVFFVNSLTFQSASATSALPQDTDWIPPFSLVEIEIAPRHSESCLAGRGINVKTMRVSTTEMDAVFQNGIDQIGLPYTADDAMRIANARREQFPALLKDIETEKIAFIVAANNIKGAYMGDLPEPEPVATGADAIQGDAMVCAFPTDVSAATAPPTASFVKLCVGGGSTPFPNCEYVDIALSVLQKQTNTCSDTHACAMLDLALAMGAVNLFAITDDRWRSRGDRSCYRAVPVIDTAILFAPLQRVRTIATDHVMVATYIAGVVQTVKETGAEVLERVELVEDAYDGDEDGSLSFKINTGVDFDEGKLELVCKVASEDLVKTRGDSVFPQKNGSLALCGPNVSTTRGYYFKFNIVCETDPAKDIPCCLHGFVNRASGGVSSGIMRKRKAITMD